MQRRRQFCTAVVVSTVASYGFALDGLDETQERKYAIGAAKIPGIVGGGLQYPRPERGCLLGCQLFGANLFRLAVDLDLGLGVGFEVEIPARMGWQPAVRCDDYQVWAVREVLQ
jgi:hypothetical protein